MVGGFLSRTLNTAAYQYSVVMRESRLRESGLQRVAMMIRDAMKDNNVTLEELVEVIEEMGASRDRQFV